MPSWSLPALLTCGLTLLTSALGVIWLEIKASEASTSKRLDDNEARTGKRLDELGEDMRALGAKVDRLVESLLATRQS